MTARLRWQWFSRFAALGTKVEIDILGTRYQAEVIKKARLTQNERLRGCRTTPSDTALFDMKHHWAEVDMTENARRGRRGGGRDARRQARDNSSQISSPFLVRNVAPVDFLSDEGCALIEDNAETVLEEIGIEFRDDPEALEILKDVGCDVAGERVHFPRGLARKLCASAPSSFTQYARNPARSVEIGGNNTVFAPVYGPPFVRDLEGERRYAEMEDFRNFVRLVYMLPGLHHSGGTVCEPVDLPVTKRHLEMVYAHMRLSDKPFMGSVTAASRAADTVEMCRILFGDEFVSNNCVTVSLINANSPMTWDDTMVGALKVYARANQGTVISPFILAGAMSPVSVGGIDADSGRSLSGIAFGAVKPVRLLFLAVLPARFQCRQGHQPLARQNLQKCYMDVPNWHVGLMCHSALAVRLQPQKQQMRNQPMNLHKLYCQLCLVG